jgi:hypothetical protein
LAHQSEGPRHSADLGVALFETELLTREENLVGLTALNRDLLAHTEVPK